MYNTVKTLMGSFHMLTLYLSPPFQTDFYDTDKLSSPQPLFVSETWKVH